MISSKNRVQAIKSKFENLNIENESIVAKKKNLSGKQLCKQSDVDVNTTENSTHDKENGIGINCTTSPENENFNDTENRNQWSPEPPEPNNSYLYSKNDLKRSISDTKKSLSRQSSDPGKKLHRSHAFRCDRSQKINHSPKRHGSCNGRSETSDFSYKMGERKLTKERLKLLGDFIEDQMRKDKFPIPMDAIVVGTVQEVKSSDSIPDSQVPKHILDQYAKVVKGSKSTEKQDAMTDSGVSSETENLEEEKSSKIKQLIIQYEKSEEACKEQNTKDNNSVTSDSNSNLVSTDTTDSNTNLESMNNLCASSETMRLEKKNPHLILTDTLKKALKQPLPPGPPPKKPPRTFIAPIPESPDKQRKDPRKMLEKLEQVLQKREADKTKNIYDIAEGEVAEKKPKEMHYLCTEILDIAQRTLPNQNELDPFSKCLNSLNCAIVINNSMTSLPYTRLSSEHRNSIGTSCSCSNDSLNNPKLKTFGNDKCVRCQNNNKNEGFICHLNCKCKETKSEFYVKEHIYDEPFIDCSETNCKRQYGTLNSLKISKSMEDLRTQAENQKIYDIPCEITPHSSPKLNASPKSEFQKLRENFEKPKADINETTKINANTLKPIDCNGQNKSVEKPNNLPPKPTLASKPKISKSSENISEDFKTAKRSVEKKFSTDGRRYRRFERSEGRRCGLSLPKDQLDVDKENLNRLMTEIYETVTAACNMDENKPPSFPTEHSDGSTSEESFRLTRSLTESRKNYVRRVSSRVAYLDQKHLKQRVRHQTSVCSYKSEILDNPYSTFRSWKSFRTSQSNLRDKMERRDSTDSKFNLTDSRGNILSIKDDLAASDNSLDNSLDTLSIDEKTGCVDIGLPFEPRERGLFNVCLLVGLDCGSGQAYVKSVFPSQMSYIYSSKFILTDSRGNILSIKDDLAASDNSLDNSLDTLSIDEKTGCVDIGLPFEPRERGLFNVCLLVGLDCGSGQAYVKSVFPSQVQVPPHIENLIFPETISSESKEEWMLETKGAQCYSLVLTDERGERSYGYCRRVLPEGASVCLPLCYCLIGKYRAPGFYYKILQEIESHHGNSEIEINQILQQLFDMDFPNPGEQITITYTSKNYEEFPKTSKTPIQKCMTLPDQRRLDSRVEVSVSVRKESLDKSDDVSDKSSKSDRSEESHELPEFYDLENNNSPKHVMVVGPRTHIIKRPLEPRVDENNLSVLLDALGAGLLIKVFASLLLERKLVIMGDELGTVSSCLEGVQAALYPLVWQQPLISSVPRCIRRDVLAAPLPVLAGVLRCGHAAASAVEVDEGFEEGMLIDLTLPSKVLFYQGDESTILPTTSYKSLKTSLQMESIKNKDRQEDIKTRNVLISEAFLRFFVDILGDFSKFFSTGEVKEGALGKNGIVFDKEAFIKNASSKQNQYFLEWFTETAMFNHFIQNMAVYHSRATPEYAGLGLDGELVDTPLPNFYELFLERVRGRPKAQKWAESKLSYRNAMNRKVKLLKTKLRDLVA